MSKFNLPGLLFLFLLMPMNSLPNSAGNVISNLLKSRWNDLTRTLQKSNDIRGHLSKFGVEFIEYQRMTARSTYTSRSSSNAVNIIIDATVAVVHKNMAD